MMLLTMTAFAETITKNHTYETDNKVWSESDDTYFLETGNTYNNKTFYQKNTNSAFQFAMKTLGSGISSPYPYASGGVFMKLPFASILSGATVNEIKKVTLTLAFHFGSQARPTDDINYFVLTEVSEDELTAVKDAKSKFFTGNTEKGYTAAEHAPANLVNYMINYWCGQTWGDTTMPRPTNYTEQLKAVPEGIYNGYILTSFKTGVTGTEDFTCTKQDGTGSYNATKYTVDLTGLVKGGTLGVSDDRYLLIQKQLAKTEDENYFETPNPENIYFPVYTAGCYPVLTIEYEGETAKQADGITGNKSLYDEGSIVSFRQDYAYTVTFNGAVDGDTLTNETILIADSGENPIDLTKTTANAANRAISYDDVSKTVTIPLPIDKTQESNGEKADDGYWLTSGMTYTITFTDGVKNEEGESVFGAQAIAEGKNKVAFTMEEKEYDYYQTSIRVGESKTLVTSLAVGDTGTKKDEMVYAYSNLYNYTTTDKTRFSMIALYDANGMLVQCNYIKDRVMPANRVANACGVGIQLKQDLTAGFKIRGFVWDQDTMSPFAETRSGVNEGNQNAMTEIIVGAKVAE